jgi:hypothetical protein
MKRQKKCSVESNSGELTNLVNVKRIVCMIKNDMVSRKHGGLKDNIYNNCTSN